MKSHLFSILLFISLCITSCGGNSASKNQQEKVTLSAEKYEEYTSLLSRIQQLEIMLDQTPSFSADVIVSLSEQSETLYYTFDTEGMDSLTLANCYMLKRRVDDLREKLVTRLNHEITTLDILSYQKEDYLLECTEAFPLYLEKGDKLFYSVQTESPATIKIYNADSRKTLKTYSSKTKLNDTLEIRNSAIYLVEVNPLSTQYGDIIIGYNVHNVNRLNNLCTVNTEIVEGAKGDFRVQSTSGIKMSNLFEEPRKFTLRGQLKAAFSGSYRGIVAIQVPAGTTDILYRLRISTDEADMYSDGDFAEDMDHSYRKIKMLGLPVYESSRSIGLIKTILGDNKPPREEDAYINMFVFTSSSQAKKFQDGTEQSKLQYNVNYSTMGTQSCNGRIPMNGMRTIYLGFENERMRFHNYVWLEVLAIAPKTEYFKAQYTIVKN